MSNQTTDESISELLNRQYACCIHEGCYFVGSDANGGKCTYCVEISQNTLSGDVIGLLTKEYNSLNSWNDSLGYSDVLIKCATVDCPFYSKNTYCIQCSAILHGGATVCHNLGCFEIPEGNRMYCGDCITIQRVLDTIFYS